MGEVSVRCWSCGFDHLEEPGYCAGCGTRLTPSCPACGALICDTTFDTLLQTMRRGVRRRAPIRDPGVGLRTA